MEYLNTFNVKVVVEFIHEAKALNHFVLEQDWRKNFWQCDTLSEVAYVLSTLSMPHVAAGNERFILKGFGRFQEIAENTWELQSEYSVDCGWIIIKKV